MIKFLWYFVALSLVSAVSCRWSVNYQGKEAPEPAQSEPAQAPGETICN